MKPEFISTDSELIISELVSYYEGLTGKPVQPGQPEMLLINAIAYREKLIREGINAAGLQNLISFSVAPMLDYIVELVGVTRLSSAVASCTIRCTLSAGHPGIVIPANTRIKTDDGKVVFATSAELTIPAGSNTVDVLAFASETGNVGNDYAAGTINNILDPVAYLSSATNIDTSFGGTDQETDEELRERAKTSSGQFSTAGPEDAYKFFAKSASPTIIDVGVGSDIPGTVQVYPLVEGGIVTPAPILQLVLDKLNAKKVRPLSDTVTVASPTVITYDIQVDVVLYTGTDSVTAKATIISALEEYKETRSKTLGRDILPEQIIALSMFDVDQIFDVEVISPSANIVVNESSVAVCNGVVVNITGTNDG